jgi:hypothetical protein
MKSIPTLLVLFSLTIVLTSFSAPDRLFNLPGTTTLTKKPNDPRTGESVIFMISEFGNSKSFTWDFGDGTEPVETFDCSSSHVYSKSGTYKVKVRSNEGRAVIDMVMVTD